MLKDVHSKIDLMEGTRCKRSSQRPSVAKQTFPSISKYLTNQSVIPPNVDPMARLAPTLDIWTGRW